MDVERLINSSRPFLTWLVRWYNNRPALDMAQAVREAGGPDHAAVLAVDVTVGCCQQGALASERVGRIVEPIVRLLERAHELGIRHFILPQDTHAADAVEFECFPPHCVRGSEEAVTVPEIAALPFADRFWVIEKDSLSSDINTGLDDWLKAHPEVTTFFVVGDCTDFCVYQLAMHLRLWANAHKRRGVRVIVPLDGVDTFDIPVEVAEEIGAMPHHGDLMHLIFLFSMAQNGVEIVERVD